MCLVRPWWSCTVRSVKMSTFRNRHVIITLTARISGPVSHTCCSWCTQNTDRNAPAISLLRGHAHWFAVTCHTHTEYFVLTLTLRHHHYQPLRLSCSLPHAVNVSELRKILFLAPSVCVVCIWNTSGELLNRFAPNSHGRCVWSLARMSLKVKGQGHQGQKLAFLAYVWSNIFSLWLVSFLIIC